MARYIHIFFGDQPVQREGDRTKTLKIIKAMRGGSLRARPNKIAYTGNIGECATIAISIVVIIHVVYLVVCSYSHFFRTLRTCS